MWLACLAAFFGACDASAQIQIQLSLPRRTFVIYEPLIATVTLTNQAGRDVTFEDVPGKQWFNVEITTLDGQVLQPYDRNYHLPSLKIPAGQTLTRKIDLNPLFPIREFGTYRMRANVYLAENDRFYASSYATFDIADAQLIWREDVGVPGGDGVRQMSLLTFQRLDRLMLYVRVRDQEGPTVYTTQPLGRLVSTGRGPEAMLDRQNTLHILQEAAPSAYLYTEISVEGEWLTQRAYQKAGTRRPSLIKLASGDVEVQGGQVQAAPTPGVAAATAREPKLSDRPSTLPGTRKPAEQ